MYTKVLVAVDGSAFTKAVLAEAGKLAAAGARLLLLTVVDNPLANFATPYGIAYDHEALHQALQDQARAALTAAQEQLQQAGIQADAELVTVGGEHGVDVPSAIEQRAESWGAELIVAGTHGRRGLRRLLLGSVAEHLLRQATVPLLLVREQEA